MENSFVSQAFSTKNILKINFWFSIQEKYWKNIFFLYFYEKYWKNIWDEKNMKKT